MYVMKLFSFRISIVLWVDSALLGGLKRLTRVYHAGRKPPEVVGAVDLNNSNAPYQGGRKLLREPKENTFSLWRLLIRSLKL